MFDNLVEKLKANPKRIVYTEGTDARILESAARLKKDGFLTPVLLGNVEDVKAAAAKGGFDIEGLEIIDPENYDGMDAMVEQMVELRRGKMTADECRAALKKSNYFGTMLVKMGLVDSLLGGATYSTADTVRPALQLVKTKPGRHQVSSSVILTRGDELYVMGDGAINISYEAKLDKDGNVVSPLPSSWPRRRSSARTPRRSSVWSPASRCCPTPPTAPATARTLTSCATPPPSPRPRPRSGTRRRDAVRRSRLRDGRPAEVPR